MSDGHHVLFLVEVAVGVVLGFVLWSYVSPMLSSVAPQPTT